jgi:hypothetical protein
MVKHKTPETFRDADQAAHAFVSGDTNHPVGSFLHCQGSTHFSAIAALIANINLVIIPIFVYPNGAF